MKRSLRAPLCVELKKLLFLPCITLAMLGLLMNDTRGTDWSAARLLELGRSYQEAAVFLAAAELDLFSALAREPQEAVALARQVRCDLRGLTTLLDALAALGLVEKRGASYLLSAGAAPFLTAESARTILAMAQHQANCLRRWAQLAMVVKQGRPADILASVRGQQGDAEAFIGAMHNISSPVADEVIRALNPLQFTHLLDVGGASGTWTMAFLRACSGARATLFDLAHVIPMARERLSRAGFGERVNLVAGDFENDPLPAGADLCWLSAIVHQNSREQNRRLFGKVHAALASNGRLAIRDIVMDPTRTQPTGGALFAINMLVATEGGGTFTFEELREDMERAGFTAVAQVREDPWMNAVVVGRKA